MVLLSTSYTADVERLFASNWTDWLLRAFTDSRLGSNSLYILFAAISVILGHRSRKAWMKGQSSEFQLFAKKRNLMFESGNRIVIPALRTPFLGGSLRDGLVGGEIPTDPVLAEFSAFFDRFRSDKIVLQNDDSPPSYAAAIMSGVDQNGVRWKIFQHFSGNAGSSWCLIAESPVFLPWFRLSPESTATRTKKTMGATELQVENQAFNDRYYIETRGPDQVLHLLHPRVIDSLMYLPAVTWEFSGKYVMVCLPSDASSSSLETYYNAVVQFIKMIPAYYKKDFGLPPSA